MARAIEDDSTVSSYIDHYNYDFGRQLAGRGYMVLWRDTSGFGERDAGTVMPVDPCDRMSNKAARLVISLLGLTVWDDRRGLDFLRSGHDVDPEHLGVVRLSLGGTRATYLAALDDRVTATVVSRYLNTFKRYASPSLAWGDY